MTPSPFQSILDMQHRPNTTPKHANDEQDHDAVDTLIANLLAKPASPHAAAPTPSSSSSSSVLGAIGTSTPPKRPAVQGGIYADAAALNLLNSHYFVGRSKQETAIFRINDDGTISFVPNEQFKLEVQNIVVQVGGRLLPADKYWRESRNRHERELVFKPGDTARPHEYNLWRGFGMGLRRGWQKQRRILRHLRTVICRRDKQKFKYLMRLLAWFVQNPDKHAGVVLVLKSREQGTGKSTVGKVMLDIFGQHGFLVDDKDRLLGRFNDWLENACFILAEEILFAGDPKSADKLKSMITGDILPIERKFGSVRQVPNLMKVIATTNHDHAVPAGIRDRRYVVYDVSSEQVGNALYFDELYRDLADGGTSEFFWLLKNLRLGDWHPRRTIKTEETTEQQRMSGDSVSQWAQACVGADAIIGLQGQFGGPQHSLGQPIASEHLQAAYAGYCRQLGLRALSEIAFGKACTEMFGPRRRLPSTSGASAAQSIEDVGAPGEIDRALDQSAIRLLGQSSGGLTPSETCPGPGQEPPASTGPARRRPWGYDVPDGDAWQRRIDARLGLRQ